MRVPVNITGGHYKHKSRPLVKQVTRNWWPQVQQQTDKARSKYILQSFCGLRTFKVYSGSSNRGMIFNQNVLYRVLDTNLYSVSSNGTHTSLGTIPGTNRCILKAIGRSIIIANGDGEVYVWNGSVLTQVTDVNLINPRGVAVLNNQAIYDEGTGQSFDVSDVGDASTINGLNNASAESFSDDLLIPYAWRETLYLLGTDTTELWWNSGQGNPPFDRIQGAALPLGLGAVHSVADTPDFMFLFGSDKQFHSLTPGSSTVDTPVSTPAMTKEIEGYTETSDCIGWTMQLQGQWFYVATFPTEDVTWVFPIGGEWFQWGTGEGRIRADSYAFAYNKHIVAGYNTGNLYELDMDVYDDAGDAIVRTRDTAPIHSGMIGPDNKEFEINDFELVLETGVGLLTGQGSDPRVMISVSRDGGKSFGTEKMLRTGGLNEQVTVRTGPLGRFKSSCVIRVRVSDPIYWAIYSADLEMEICI